MTRIMNEAQRVENHTDVTLLSADPLRFPHHQLTPPSLSIHYFLTQYLPLGSLQFRLHDVDRREKNRFIASNQVHRA